MNPQVLLFEKYLKENQLHYSLRASDSQGWDNFYSQLKFQPVEFSNLMRSYYFEYYTNLSRNMIDLSIIIYSTDKKPIAIWTLDLIEEENEFILTSNGSRIAPPIFSNTILIQEKRKISKKCIKTLQSFAAALEISKLKLDLNIVSECSGYNLNPWSTEVLKSGALVELETTLLVDLALDLPEIKSMLRKSYKSLINRGYQIWDISVIDISEFDESIWQEFRQLHYVSAGNRSTRAPITWDIQGQQIINDAAVLVVARNQEGALVGAAFCSYTRDEAIYASAAYDRSLFHLPVGHSIQWEAIKYLKEKNIRYYRLGRFCRNNGSDKFSTKEISISKFKEGFATDMRSILIANIKVQ